MTTDKKPFPIPVNPAPQSIEEQLMAEACANSEPFVLMVLGDQMLPEFEEGWVITIDPSAPARDGSYVVVEARDDLWFRQLVKHAEGWMLKPLNPIYENIPLDDLSGIKGVVVQKSRPGKRKESKRYE
ncbi:MAG: S24 family peptidase [Gallionellaceae bacterium]|nr:S24 family peptidase [Gallionellaceae bacterium]